MLELLPVVIKTLISLSNIICLYEHNSIAINEQNWGGGDKLMYHN
jgi:hypothetical protein